MKTLQTASHWGVYNVVLDDTGEIGGTTPFARDPRPAGFNPALPERCEIAPDVSAFDPPVRITEPGDCSRA